MCFGDGNMFLKSTRKAVSHCSLQIYRKNTIKDLLIYRIRRRNGRVWSLPLSCGSKAVTINNDCRTLVIFTTNCVFGFCGFFFSFSAFVLVRDHPDNGQTETTRVNLPKTVLPTLFAADDFGRDENKYTGRVLRIVSTTNEVDKSTVSGGGKGGQS